MAKLKELYDPISKKVKSGKYLVEGGYEAYQSALNIAKENYYSSESIGFMVRLELPEFHFCVSFRVAPLIRTAFKRQPIRKTKRKCLLP